MRHDPAGAAVVVMLRSLKMYGMAQAAGELMEQGAPAYDSAVPILSQSAQGGDRRARGSLGCVSDQSGAVPRLQGSERLQFCLQRSQRGSGAPASPVRVY